MLQEFGVDAPEIRLPEFSKDEPDGMTGKRLMYKALVGKAD